MERVVVSSHTAVLRGIASLVDSEKNRRSSTPSLAEKSRRSSSSAGKNKRAAVTDECAKPSTPSKVAKKSADKNEASSTDGPSAPVSKGGQPGASSPLIAAAIVEGEAAAVSKSAVNSQAGHTGGPLYSEVTTRRLRDTLQQNRQRLEGRLAALEKRSEHLGALTVATGVENC